LACRVGKTLRFELVQAPRCHPCQRFEKLLILLTHCHKGPCRVGELLRCEPVQAPLCHPCQRSEKLLIPLTHCRKGPCFRERRSRSKQEEAEKSGIMPNRKDKQAHIIYSQKHTFSQQPVGTELFRTMVQGKNINSVNNLLEQNSSLPWAKVHAVHA